MGRAKSSGYCIPIAVAICASFAFAAAAQTARIFPLAGAAPAAMALDQQGNSYLVGTTTYSNFPASANALQATLKAPTNAFIAKLSPTGQLLWATYFGGSASDSATGVAVDPSGNVLVTGTTFSSDLPMLNAFQSTLAGEADAFVLKLDPNGKMLYSTYCGGSLGDWANAIAVDSAGAAYITGITNSNDFPGQGPLAGFVAAYVVKLAADGKLVYSYESTETDAIPAAIAVDASGSTYVAGGDSGSQVTAYPAFVYKLSPDGSQAIYKKHFGGSQFNNATAITLDSTGAVYVAGVTTSLDFPVVNPIQSTPARALCGPAPMAATPGRPSIICRSPFCRHSSPRPQRRRRCTPGPAMPGCFNPAMAAIAGLPSTTVFRIRQFSSW